MEKKFTEDNELKELLIEQYIKEAEAMEAALFADADFEDLEMTDEEVQASYEKLVECLKAEGEYREEPSSLHDKIIPMPAVVEVDEKESTAAKRTAKKKKTCNVGQKQGRLARVAGLVLVCCLSVFAGSMTSEANRRYFINAINVFSGNDTRIVIDNDDANENINESEYLALENIEKQLDVEVPEFYYRPESLKFVKYEVVPYSGVARMEYMFMDNIMMLYIDKQNEINDSSGLSFHGKESSQIITSKDGVKIEVKKVKYEGDKEPNCFSQWKKDNVVYQFTGKMKYEEFVLMLEKMKF